MQLTKITLFTLLGLAVAAPVKRTPAAIESAISTISSQLDTLDSDIKAFTGSIIQGLGLLTVVNNLESDISTATSDVTSTGTLSSSDSATIYAAVSALSTKIGGVLSDAEAKASTVASAGFTSLVQGALKTLKSDADSFFTALESTINSGYTSQVTALQATIDAAFNTAIADF